MAVVAAGRFIQDNFMLLDITKAFDSVSWPFLIEVMKWIADITGSLSSESLDHILVSCVFAREFCSLSGKGGTTDLFALVFVFSLLFSLKKKQKINIQEKMLLMQHYILQHREAHITSIPCHNFTVTIHFQD
ncbi:hypothetical protein ACJX0J_035755, partial [Zea mays]